MANKSNLLTQLQLQYRDRNDYSVAYYGFELKETLEAFIQKFNNFTIQDEKSKSYVLLVQRSIYPSFPINRKQQAKSLAGTITEDDDYKQFLENQQKLQQKALLIQQLAAQPSIAAEEPVLESKVSKDSEQSPVKVSDKLEESKEI